MVGRVCFSGELLTAYGKADNNGAGGPPPDKNGGDRRVQEKKMKKEMLITILITAVAAGLLADKIEQKKIIPVNTWPRVLNVPGKQVINPSVDQCVAAGYRILRPAPVVSAGKQVVEKKIEQCPDDPSYAIVVYVLEDKPVVIPTVVTNVPADEVEFKFTNEGLFLGVRWKNAITNSVK